MSLTLTQGRDSILTQLRTFWLANTPAVTGGAAPVLRYQNVPGEAGVTDPPPQGVPYANVFVRHNPSAGGQRTFGGVGQRRFERRGITTIQIFVPLGEGEAQSDGLAQIAIDAFEGKATPEGVWFRNVGDQEVGADENWYQVNVLAEFEYDQVK